mmetsp:Transcript_110650/g.319668  ORF Transcript_110650/g.319668 Transcript_110650/m.319668 type:complete len:158 (+) Transcript_110650:83-556(+)|eukprot:CAMPEP_0176122286 /NCGR_PEP_ID=MMETSP0120_2-20121206/61586_1 /TAXON_ID=160619 /ORGANISM="Kryptoperidinium foliaceum, Strain CCMP 1326" /LENGTH=157 /DNA_ID=CAMNT_0017456905 /DNA_START=72 /DNA_END=545 /DNA_ORIENTATION=+
MLACCCAGDTGAVEYEVDFEPKKDVENHTAQVIEEPARPVEVKEEPPALKEEEPPIAEPPISKVKVPFEFDVILVRTPDVKKLGVNTVAHPDPPAISITAVLDGLLDEWNKKETENRVEVGDRIIAVNDEKSTVERMYDAMALATTVRLRISRPVKE